MALPNTYRQLPYIESNGTQYIAPSIAGNVVGRVECALIFTADTRQIFFGCWNDSSYRSYIIERTSGGNFSASAGGMTFTAQNTIAMPVGQRNVIDYNLNSNYVDVNGTRAYTTSGYPSTSRALYLFASNDSQASGGFAKASCQLEYLKVYNKSGTLTYDYIPALRLSDNVAGIYNLINDTFLPSSNSYAFLYPFEVSAEDNPEGTGTFTGTGYHASGTSVSLEANANGGFEFENWLLKGYTRLDYIENIAKSFINTEMYADNTCKFETKFQFTSTTANQQTGQYTGSNILWGINGQNLFLCYANGDKTYGNADTNWHTFIIDLTNNTGSVDNNTQSLTGFSGTSAYPFYLFSRRDNSGNYTSYNCLGKVEYHKVYKNNALVQYLIPVIRHSDSSIGMLDLVQLKFYGNSGTGSFIGGEIYAS